MSDQFSCAEAEALLFEFHRAELSDLKREAFDEHLKGCAACRELTQKISGAFELASSADAELWAEFDPDRQFEEFEKRVQGKEKSDDSEDRLDASFRLAGSADAEVFANIEPDALFDRISERVESVGELEPVEEAAFERARSADAEAFANIEPDALFDRISEKIETRPEPMKTAANDEVEDGSRRWSAKWVVVAVAACAALFTWWGLSSGDTAGDPVMEQGEVEPVEVASAVVDEEQVVDALVQPVEREPVDQSERELPPLLAAASQRNSVEIFASEEADYRFSEDKESSTVDLVRGSLLVDFLPESDDEAEFSVKAGGHTVLVVGTVFFVEVQEDDLRVAVLEGAVEVRSPDGEVRKVGATEFVAGEEAGVLSEKVRSQVDLYIDLEAHRRALREARLAPEPEVPEVVEVAVVEPVAEPEVELELEVESPRELRSKALEAMHQGDYRGAVESLSDALENTEPGAQAGADILLELARIHLRHLDEPQEAANYLSRFLAEWPEDPTADAIREQLCSMDDIEPVAAGTCEEQ